MECSLVYFQTQPGHTRGGVTLRRFLQAVGRRVYVLAVIQKRKQRFWESLAIYI